MNLIVLEGNLGGDPEIKMLSSEKKMARFNVATKDGYGDNQKTNWHRCVAFGKTAETIEKYMKKGSEILLQGSVSYNEHEGKHYTSILVDRFEFVGSKESTQVSVNNQGHTVDQDGDDLPF